MVGKCSLLVPNPLDSAVIKTVGPWQRQTTGHIRASKYGDLVYKFQRIDGKPSVYSNFKSVITLYKK